MTDREFTAKLDELDRLLNDPEIRMDPDRVWSLLAEVKGLLAPAADGVAATGAPALEAGSLRVA